MGSAGKAGRDLTKLRALAVCRSRERGSDMDEAGDALVRRESEPIEHPAVIGVPFRDPARGIAEGVGGEHQVHRGGARGELLLPYGNLHVLGGPAHDGNDERGPREPFALEIDLLSGRIGPIRLESPGDDLAGGGPAVALEYDETPRRELAVVGYPRGDGEQRLDLGGVGPGPGKLHWFDRAARPEQMQSVRHARALRRHSA